MCRGYQPNKLERLSINGFYLRLSFSFGRKVMLPNSLILHLLPRINGGFLEIDGSIIPPNNPGFITMDRIASAEKLMKKKKKNNNKYGVVVYGSREKLKASEGSRFEIFTVGGDGGKLLKGYITRDDESENWGLECKCLLEEEDEFDFVKDADICVAIEEQSRPMYKKVEMRRRKVRCFHGLDDIPEEKEGESEEGEENDKRRCWCDECNGCDGAEDGEEMVTEVDDDDWDAEEESTEGVAWAAEVGILVVCLGFGYFLSRASFRRLKHTKLF